MKRKGRKGRRRPKKATHVENLLEDDSVPRSFVIHHGVISSNVRELLSDFKFVMKPNTAEKLMAKKRNCVSDFVSMSGPYKVSHLLMFSQTENGIILKIGRLPQGPTLTFSIDQYTLKKDVLSNQKKQILDLKMFLYSPCLMTNLQPAEGKQHLQLCAKIFLDMFPSINPAVVKTHHIKRCCLIHYDEELGTFDFRHYAIRTRPVGISKATKKMISNKVPNLGAFNEVSDFVVKSEILSDSEGEEDSSMHVEILKKKKKLITKEKSVIKLSEIGPRLTMKLVKIEDGLCEGTVLHHSYIEKTPEEILKIEKNKRKEERLRKMRRKEQEKNIKKKEEDKEAHRKKCLLGMGIDASSSQNKSSTEDISDDDDAEYYRQEVGEEPDADLFKRKFKSNYDATNRFKKRKQ